MKCMVLMLSLGLVSCGAEDAAHPTALSRLPETRKSADQAPEARSDVSACAEGQIKAVTFFAIGMDSGLVFTLTPGTSRREGSKIDIWRDQTTCVDGKTHLSYLGRYELPIASQTDEAGSVRFFVEHGEQLYMVGSVVASDDGNSSLPLCRGSTAQLCTFSSSAADGIVQLDIDFGTTRILAHTIELDQGEKSVPLLDLNP